MIVHLSIGVDMIPLLHLYLVHLYLILKLLLDKGMGSILCLAMLRPVEVEGFPVLREHRWLLMMMGLDST